MGAGRNELSVSRQDIELYTQKEIRYLQVAIYYIGYCIKTLLRRRRQPYLHCQSFMALSGTNDIIFVGIGFFSVEEIPTKHSSLYSNIKFNMPMFLLSFQNIVVEIFTS